MNTTLWTWTCETCEPVPELTGPPRAEVQRGRVRPEAVMRYRRVALPRSRISLVRSRVVAQGLTGDRAPQTRRQCVLCHPSDRRPQRRKVLAHLWQYGCR